VKKVTLSVGEFSVPAPLRGSIDAHSGFGRATELGQEIHQRVQEKRKKDFPDFEAERAVKFSFFRGEYEFEVGGRMDGFFPPSRIEEIKSSFNTFDLKRRLQDHPWEHPYCLQLQTYGYILWKQTGVLPTLSFHLVSTRNFESSEQNLPFEPHLFEEWLDRRLVELEELAIAAEKRAERRRKVAENLEFPFPTPRSGQIELIATVEEGMREKKRMLVQAPTGLGKTVGVLYPAMREALARGQKVIYVTPKNSQHALAEEAVAKLQEKGAKIRSLTITAKSKICFKNEPICNPQNCEYADGHYTKMGEHKVLEKLAQKKKLSAKVFKKMGQDFEVCPFEIQLDAALDADTIICDYNYVFAPRSALRESSPGLGQVGKPNLVIDEAHNLPSRAMDYYSPSVSIPQLERMRDDLRELPERFRADALVLLDLCVRVVEECRPGEGLKAAKIDPPADLFQEQDNELRAFLSRYLESETDILAGDPVLKLCFYWSAFTEALEFVAGGARPEFFTTYQPGYKGGAVKITCCDASEMLKSAYGDYEQVVGFSATLKPFQYYARLSGLEGENLKTAEFLSPFPKANRKLLIIPQISSKFSEREKNFPKVAETISRIVAEKPGNYFAFFPSFDFLEKVFTLFKEPEGFLTMRQERYMRPDDVEGILTHLQSESHPTVVFAVQGGVFSEGIDYSGRMIIGAFVVGPPLPSFDLEREEMRAYYEKNFSAGFDYAYTFPAMAKAVQAAGRVIRSETDKGIIVLMDDRFLQPSYHKSMPQGWFEQSPRELVSSAILKEVSDFWRE
jgi:DNA excision repair protein ERCC-2